VVLKYNPWHIRPKLYFEATRPIVSVIPYPGFQKHGHPLATQELLDHSGQHIFGFV
jgi:hypothetical protein